MNHPLQKQRRPTNMTTRIVTGGMILVIAIVFAFIFWNQFSSNQHTLSGDNSTVAIKKTPSNDSVSSIETDLNTIDTNIDSDSTQFDAELQGF